MICVEDVYNNLQSEKKKIIGSGRLCMHNFQRHSSRLVILILLLLTSTFKTTAEIFNEI